jgi:hypothetical protein
VPHLLKKVAAQRRGRVFAAQRGAAEPQGQNGCDIDNCGRKSPSRHNLFSIPGVIHGGDARLCCGANSGRLLLRRGMNAMKAKQQ